MLGRSTVLMNLCSVCGQESGKDRVGVKAKKFELLMCYEACLARTLGKFGFRDPKNEASTVFTSCYSNNTY